MMTTSAISTQSALRDIYGTPRPDSLAVRCVLPSLDQHHQDFIALSPFIVLSSADAQGHPDVSPRGDLPGFVRVLDEYTLVIPDRSGNKKLVTLTNILENPHVALVFFVPGRMDTLRVTGTARITTEPTLLESLAVQGNLPKSCLVVQVEEAWLHCGKALLRSRLWVAEAQVDSDALPPLGRMLADQVEGLEGEETDSRLETYYQKTLWSEPQG